VNNLWAQKFSQTAISKSTIIDDSYIPHWLKPPAADIPERPESLDKTTPVIAADNLSKKDISIVWEQTRGEAKDELDKVLQVAISKNIPIPNTHQKIRLDPRLAPSGGAFRDSIRRQFNYMQLQMNIRNLEL
jgi:hypothetical protein